jgi:glutaredoxin
MDWRRQNNLSCMFYMRWKMQRIFCALLVLLVSIGSAQADTLYRWQDKEGKVHYGDRPAADAVDAESKRFAAPATAGEGDLPYSVRKAMQDFPVTLYVTPSCGDYCVQARAFLNKRGVPFSEKNVASKEEIEEFKRITSGEAVPTLIVGKSILKGYESGQWNAELDMAGYPKSAPYGMKPQAPAAVKTAEPKKEAQ